MAKEAKFDFTPEDLIAKTPANKGVEYRVSLVKSVVKGKTEPDGSPSYQYLIYFPRDVIFIYDLKGKRIKFYLDAARKAIAWRIIDEATSISEFSSGREIKPVKSGSWTTTITKLIHHSKIKIDEGRSMIPVRKYTTTGYLEGPVTFFYIEL